MAPVQVSGVNVPLLTGPLVLAYMWGYGLYGVLLVQLCKGVRYAEQNDLTRGFVHPDIYHITFRNDKFGFKIFVWLLFLLETVFTIFTTIAAWHTYGTGWGDPDALTIIDVAWEPLPALNGFIGAMVQSFYVYRIWTLTKNLWLAFVIEAVALMQCTLAFYYGIAVSVRGRHINELFALTPSISAWLSGSAACDFLITASLVTILYRSKTKAVFSHTTNHVTRLIRYTVETGLLTSVVAVCELILWLTDRQYNFHFIGFLVLSKLYSNTLLATLNSRALMFSGHQRDYEHQSAFIATTPHNTTTFWDEMEPLDTGLSSIYQPQTDPSVSQPAQDVANDFDANVLVISNHSGHPSAASTSAGALE
ncbi:hypothetical protein IW261DRAFT_1564887 [Armillaria novae-zelandiae]|uniref:DUF6534 domain-containing protein n=1 Tax=Armillaria novae-zelandiae TaxID=153914 RepID=A0AA39P817_9AGAR|nr:hypothetical protein IW261DRAFT_1564887 [Armillaria novae-zelandiae]